MTRGVQICAPLIKFWLEPLRCWNFYSIFIEVSALSKKPIHSFNPKTNFLETVLNQTSEKKVKWRFSQGNFKNRKIFLRKPVKEVWLHINKNTICYIYHIPYTIMQKSNQKIAMLYCMVIGTAKTFLKHMFLTCCITTRLTKSLDTGNITFFLE